MKVLAEFYTKSFKNSELDLKKAYEKAVNWYGKNVLSKPGMENVTVKYEVIRETAEVVITLYSIYESDEEKKRHCKACKEWHTQVFNNEFFNCYCCNMISFDKKVKDRLKIKAKWYKDLMNK